MFWRKTFVLEWNVFLKMGKYITLKPNKKKDERHTFTRHFLSPCPQGTQTILKFRAMLGWNRVWRVFSLTPLNQANNMTWDKTYLIFGCGMTFQEANKFLPVCVFDQNKIHASVGQVRELTEPLGSEADPARQSQHPHVKVVSFTLPPWTLLCQVWKHWWLVIYIQAQF